MSVVRVAALTGGLNAPSSIFRVRQHIEPLAREGVLVREYLPRVDAFIDVPPRYLGRKHVRRAIRGALWGVKTLGALPNVLQSHRHEVTWIQRELVPGLPTLELLARRPIVFDVDDAVWLHKPAGALACRLVGERAETVLAGNAHIAEWFSRYNKRVRIVPTAVDTGRYVPASGSARSRFVVGWIGTPSNFQYLEPLDAVFAELLKRCPEMELLIVSERPPRFPSVSADRVRFERWSAEGDVAALQRMDVGLMPLADDAWARGKCGFKMLQYMSCGLPVVVSPVGVNRDILARAEVGFGAKTSTEWVDALEFLYRHRERGVEMGRAGRRVVEEGFSRTKIVQQLAAVFHEVR